MLWFGHKKNVAPKELDFDGALLKRIKAVGFSGKHIFFESVSIRHENLF